ncbi:hypothetical protein GF389_03945 [Candidatus Dojkabacteria bacterium]|nr:hypothetical protein [Candidatus Dojkabacteria bacterium]
MNNKVRISASVSCETVDLKEFEIYFEFDNKYEKYLTNRLDPFLVASIIPSMGIPEDIRIEGGIDKVLTANLTKMMSIISNWEVSDSWHKKVVDVKISATELLDNTKEKKEKTAMFFTAGVDSFYTLEKLRDAEEAPDYLITIFGYDIALDNIEMQRRLSKTLKQVSDSTNIEVIRINSNYREFLDKFPPNSANQWEMCHGSGLTSAALCLDGLYQKVYINSSDAYLARSAYGTHPDIDKLWSTSLLSFVSFGDKNRIEKIDYIKNKELPREHLRVCWRNHDNKYNCGRCEKCIRTMLQLKIYGVLRNFITFENEIDAREIQHIDLAPKHRVYIWEYFYRKLGSDNKQEILALKDFLIRSYQHIINENSFRYKLYYYFRMISLRLGILI